MSTTSGSTSFDPEDLAIVANLKPEGAEPGTDPGFGVSYSAEDGGPTDATAAPASAPAAPAAPAPAPVADAPAPAIAAPAPTPAPTAAPAAAAPAADAPAPAPAPADDEHKGNLRNALRAARHDARKKEEENARLRQELEQARAGNGNDGGNGPDADEDPLTMSAERLAEIERDFPLQAKTIKHLRELHSRVAAPASANPPAQDEWVPPVAPPAVQDVIDQVPDLLAWQMSRDGQEAFNLAAAHDERLRHLPAWKGKTAVERFTEAARLAKADLAGAATPPAAPPNAAAQAQAVIDSTAAAPAVGISDFRGGGPANPPEIDMSRMSDEEIMRTLPVQD